MPQSCTSLTLPLPEAYVLRSWYRQLYRLRRVAEVISELCPRPEMGCPVPVGIGQEAIAVGVCSELGPDDAVFSRHHSHGHYLARGGSLPALLAELHSQASSLIHPIDPLADGLGAAAIPRTVEDAFGTRLRGEQRVSVAFFSTDADEEDIFCERANFAVRKRLPVVLVCTNDHRSMRPRDLSDVARGIGLTAAAGDGNDVQEVTRLARRAVRQARDQGPALLELPTDRRREPRGLTAWQELCPLRGLEERMIAAGIWDDADIAQAGL